MSCLLELSAVGKRYGGELAQDVLREVSMVMEAGELVTVWGRRRSGRSTLMRIAAGVQAPDSGSVRFAGQDLAGDGRDALGGEIGYCRRTFRPTEGRSVLDQLIVSQLARGLARTPATARARDALERVEVERCAALEASALDAAEAVRAAIARTLVHEPRLIVIDEPTLGVDLPARDGILLLLRSLADEGIAVLASTGETTGFAGSDRALSLSNGRLHGHITPQLATVLPLHQPVARRAGA
jgi:ABC-type sugar transport system ATPase subunit